MSTSYYMRAVVGQRITMSDLFKQAEGVVSCRHLVASMGHKYCPECGTLVRFGARSNEPTSIATKMFGPNATPDSVVTGDERPDETRLQVVNLAMTGDSTADLVLGVYVMNQRIPDGRGDRWSAEALTEKGLAAAFDRVRGAFGDAGYVSTARLFLVPYISY